MSAVTEKRAGVSGHGSATLTSPADEGVSGASRDIWWTVTALIPVCMFTIPVVHVLILCAEAIVTPFTSDYLSAYLSLCPSPSDAVLTFGPMDMLMAPAPNYIPTRLYNLYPHPAQDASEKKRYIVMLTSRCVRSSTCAHVRDRSRR